MGVHHPRLAGDGRGRPAGGRGPTHGHVVVGVEVATPVDVGTSTTPLARARRATARRSVSGSIAGPEHACSRADQVRVAAAAGDAQAAHAARGLVPAGVDDVLEDGRVVVEVALGELGVLQTLGAAPRRDGDRRRPRGQPRASPTSASSSVLERRDALVAVEHQPGDPEDSSPPRPRTSESITEARSVDQRGVAHVAEVDDAGDQAVVVDERVVDVQVTVHHLGAQRVPPRRDRLVVAVEGSFHCRTPVGVGGWPAPSCAPSART